MVSSPFGANKRWIATKFEYISQNVFRNGNKLQPLDWKAMERLWEFYQPEQIFAAILEFEKICAREKKYFSFFTFNTYCDNLGNVPTLRMASIVCLMIHFPNNKQLIQMYHDVLTYEEAWWPTAEMKAHVESLDAYIEEYKIRL